MRKHVALLVLLFSQLCFGADYSLRSRRITEKEVQKTLCEAQGVYADLGKQEDFNEDYCAHLTYQLKGVTYSDYGDATIYHYELTKPGHGTCHVLKYLVPAQRQVILASADPSLIGEFKMTKSTWKQVALLEDGVESCF